MRKLYLLAVAVLLSLADTFSQSYMWANTFGSSGDDRGQYITQDVNGNNYTVGLFSGTVDFDPSSSTHNLTSAAAADIYVAKYDVSGNYIWSFSIGGAGNDVANGVVLDGNGNMYIAGGLSGTSVDFNPGSGTNTLSSAGGSDIFLAKYDTSGAYQWAFRIGGTGDETAYNLALDGSASIAICGYFNGSSIDFDPGSGTSSLTANNADAFLALYNSSGNYVWAMNPSGGSGSEIANGVRFDNYGNVYFTGFFDSPSVDFDPSAGTATLGTSSSSRDIFLAKYNSVGAYRWAFQIGSSSTSDLAYSVAVDGNNQVTICGSFDGGSSVDFDPGSGTATMQATGNTGGSYDMYVAQYDSNGTYKWAIQTDGPNSEYAYGIAFDASNSIYVTGYLSGSNVDFDPGSGTAYLSTAGLNDIFLAKYSNTGTYQWAFSAGGTSQEIGITANCAGTNVLIAGYFQSSNVDFDPGSGTVSRSTAGGRDIFFAQYGTGLAPVSWLYADAQVVDERVRVRWATASELNNHYFTVERSADLQQWENLNQVPGNGTTSLVHTYADWDETPLAGTSYYRIRQTDYNGSFDHSKTMVVNRGTNIFAIYPNPSQGQITLEFEGKEPEGIFHIYNNHGSLLRSFTVQQNKQQLNLRDLPDGIYLLQYLNANTSMQRKLVFAR